jgi:putative phage-type endonuclease
VSIVEAETTIHNIEQSSPEWHEFRASHYGASEAGAVLGVSPFFPHTPEELKAVKMGILPPPYYSQAMRDGHIYEEVARVKAGETLLDFFSPVVCSRGLLSASLDGINIGWDSIIEIKVSNKSMDELEEIYKPQITQQLFVSGAKTAFLVAYRKERDDIDIRRIEYDADLMKQIIEAWENFPNVEPAPPREEEREDEEWISLARELKSTKEKIDALKKEEKEIRDKLITLADGKTAKGAGVTVYPIKPRVSIDYKRLIKHKQIEIDDDYKKVGEISWGVRVK